jgi:integrase
VLMQPVEGEEALFWHARTETAKRLRGRIESVIAYADKVEDRERLNPARWGGHLDKLLPAPAKIAKVKHHRAVAIDAAPSVWRMLAEVEGMGARALQFQVLTAARSGEVRGALWGEIDLKKAIWTVPPERTKAGKEHRVPLSEPALALLRSLKAGKPCDLVFAAESDQQLSDMTLAAVMKRLKIDAVPHGWRSTFRDWAGDRTNFPRDLIETALAHALENKTEEAYRRSDAIDKRRPLMNAWASYLTSPRKDGKVVNFTKKAA